VKAESPVELVRRDRMRVRRIGGQHTALLPSRDEAMVPHEPRDALLADGDPVCLEILVHARRAVRFVAPRERDAHLRQSTSSAMARALGERGRQAWKPERDTASTRHMSRSGYSSR
jgi:hypothetical protein